MFFVDAHRSESFDPAETNLFSISFLIIVKILKTWD
jgi:hypothetical protein